MVNAHQVHHGCLEIVDVDGVFDNVVAEFIGFAVADSFFHPGSGHPDREAARMVVAAIIVGGQFALRVIGAPKFSTPNHQRIIKQTPHFQVFDQRRRSLIHAFSHDFDVVGQVAVVIPALVVELDEFHVFFGQLSRQQAVIRESSGLAGFRAVHIENIIRLLAHVQRFGHGHLHPVRHFILADARIHFRVGGVPVVFLVQFAQIIQHPAAAGTIHSRRVVEIQNRILARAEQHALVFGRQETIAPKLGVQRLVALLTARKQHHKRRQVLVVAAQPVADPRTETGPARLLRTRLHKRHRRIVVDGFGVHGFHKTQIIGDFGVVRHQVADPRAAFTVLLEIKLAERQRKRPLPGRHSGEPLPAAHRIGQFLAKHFAQFGLVVKQFQLRWRTALEQVNDAFDLGRKVRQPALLRLIGGKSPHRVGQRTQCQRSQTQYAAPQKLAAIQLLGYFFGFVHGFMNAKVLDLSGQVWAF